MSAQSVGQAYTIFEGASSFGDYYAKGGRGVVIQSCKESAVHLVKPELLGVWGLGNVVLYKDKSVANFMLLCC